MPKVPFPGNASHACPSMEPEVLTHDKRLALSNGRSHRISKSFFVYKPSSEKSRTAASGAQTHSIKQVSTAPCWPTSYGGQPENKNPFRWINPGRCQPQNASVRPRPTCNALDGLGLFVSFSPGKKKKDFERPQRGRSFGERTPVLFRRRKRYFSFGQKIIQNP